MNKYKTVLLRLRPLKKRNFGFVFWQAGQD